MLHIHTYLLSLGIQLQEAITKYCAHLQHTLEALKRYFPTSPVSHLANTEQINHPSSNHTYTKSTPNHIHHLYAPPFITLIYTTHIISSTTPIYAPHCHPWICGRTPPEWLNCWPDGRRSWLVDHKREYQILPLARVMGVVRQQHVRLRSVKLPSSDYRRRGEDMLQVFKI